MPTPTLFHDFSHCFKDDQQIFVGPDEFLPNCWPEQCFLPEIIGSSFEQLSRLALCLPSQYD